MKATFLTVTLVFFAGFFNLSVLGQDVILLRTGDEIQSIVTEVDVHVIRYRKYENPEGPLYTIEKSKVFLIKYANGTKDVFNEPTSGSVKTDPQISSPEQAKSIPQQKTPVLLEYRSGVRQNGKALSSAEVRAVYANHQEPLNLYSSGEGFKIIGSLCQWSVIGVGIYTAIKARPLNPPESELVAKRGLITMGGLTAGWLVFANIGNAQIRKSVNIYNQSILNPEPVGFEFRLGPNQIGLAMRF